MRPVWRTVQRGRLVCILAIQIQQAFSPTTVVPLRQRCWRRIECSFLLENIAFVLLSMAEGYVFAPL